MLTTNALLSNDNQSTPDYRRTKNCSLNSPPIIRIVESQEHFRNPDYKIIKLSEGNSLSSRKVVPSLEYRKDLWYTQRGKLVIEEKTKLIELNAAIYEGGTNMVYLRSYLHLSNSEEKKIITLPMDSIKLVITQC